jgi:hypothetical protein
MDLKKTSYAPKKPQIKLEALQEEIRKRAQLVFEDRVKRGLEGNDLSDWLKAEKEIKAKYGI